MTTSPSSAARRSGTRCALAISIALLLTGTAIAIVQYKVPSILPQLMETYRMSPSTASWLMSIFTAVGVILSLPTGSLARRVGPRLTIILGCGIIIAGSGIGAFATRAEVLIASRCVEGVAFVFITVAAPLAIERFVDPAHQGMANGIWSLWICLGSVIGSSATPLVLEALGMTGAWLAYAAIVAIAAIVLAAILAREGGARATAESGDARVSDVGPGETAPRNARIRQLARPRTALFFFAYLVFNVEILAVLSYTPTFLQRAGMDASLAGFASALPGLLAVVSSPIFGRLIDRTGKTKGFYLVALAASGPATLLMLTQSGPLLWVGALLMGLIGYGAPVSCLSAMPRIAGSPALMPAVIGIFTLVQCFGEFLGSFTVPLLLGPAMDGWLLCGAAMCALGLAGTAALACCRFR